MDTSIARLSSGKRITRAHDDAAGSAIAGRMESQIRGFTMGIRHAKDGQSLVDTQEGALQEVEGILQRMRELAVQSASGVASTADRDYLDLEMEALVSEIIAIENNTKFNDTEMLGGTQFSFYTDIDVNGTAVQTVNADISVTSLGSGTKGLSTVQVHIGSSTGQASIASVISRVDSAIQSIAGMRANLGAVSNRFDHIIDN